MRNKDAHTLELIKQGLESFAVRRDAPGIEDDAAIDSLASQIVESQRRINFVTTISERTISPLRCDPHSAMFDPIRAAVYMVQRGEIDEAAWLVFLATHFGHHVKDKWRLTRDVYGCLGGEPWSWQAVSSNLKGFLRWLDESQGILGGDDGVKRRFGNHRKYTSRSATKPNGTGHAVTSYMGWVLGAGGHQALFDGALQRSFGDSGLAFDDLYAKMGAVASFGRIGRFDYLTMIGKTGIAPLSPPSPYLKGATGPLQGAKLLFGEGKKTGVYEALMMELGNELGYNMQVMEDSICNWQKSPLAFKPFRG
ncbi:hypothetical protein [uncultured Stenotrophomonas sp.]|uniref:alpha-glutamyl/putrescinyl thymine pyrophosphorylase clade 3 protein n=1 Tax=uncultured Stenotrophomonas sp. TaxID=165438 RepID=UPI0028D582F3|nr:hypothetical protein [uncultured Stenotrophomonas sp.]